MPSISSEQPPIDTDQYLAEYLNRMFIDINLAVGQVGKMPITSTIPNKPQDGNVNYFTQVILPNITQIGFWGYEQGAWTYLGSNQSVKAAYGGIRQIADLSYPNIIGTWQTVQFGLDTLPTPRYVVQDVANNALIIEKPGVYRVGVSFSVRHDEKNSSRALTFRIKNTLTGFATDTISVGTGRNMDATYFALSMLFTAAEAGIGGGLILEVMADTSAAKEIYENVVVTESTFDLNRVSEY